MPEQPQEHTPDLYAVLVDVRHALANATQLAGYALDLKASADRLLPLVGDELRKARRAIDQALTILPIVIGVLVLPACAVDLGKLAADLQRPKVAFATPAAW